MKHRYCSFVLLALLLENGDSRGRRGLQGSASFLCADYSGTDVFITENIWVFSRFYELA